MSSRFHVRDRVLRGWRERQPGRGMRDSSRTGPRGGAGPDFPGREPEATDPSVPLTEGTDPVTLDTMGWDQPEKSAAYLVPGHRNMLIDTGSALSVPNILRGLDELGIDRIDYVALTHAHPDQAGGAAVVAERFPDAIFLAHPAAGAGLADPERLVSSTREMGGDVAVRLFGNPGKVAASRIRNVVDGDSVDLGDRQVEAIATPGHTTDHLAWLDRKTGALFCGDALGIRVPGSPAIRPATPPADFSHRCSLESVERLRQSGARTIWRSHFGYGGPDLERECDRVVEAIERWYESFIDQCGKADGDEELNRRFNASLEAKLEPVAPAVRRSLELINPAWLNLAGMRAEQERESSAHGRLSDAA